MDKNLIEEIGNGHRNILILVGAGCNGKSTLSKWITSLLVNDGVPIVQVLHEEASAYKLLQGNIMNNIHKYNFRYIIHLQTDDQVELLPQNIKNSAIIYNLNIWTSANV